MWTTCPNKKRVDCTKMVVQLLVKLVARWVGLEGAYKGKKVSSRVSYGLSDRGIMRERIVTKLERWVEIEKR